MAGYLVYHPRRVRTEVGGSVVHHDSWVGNQDPYVWNDQFLHTYCHITQMKPQVGMFIFWVSGDSYPNFTQLFCDLVFLVQDKVYWIQANRIEPTDPIVDSPQAFADHYRWAGAKHRFKKRRRFTLKADQCQSWQPQEATGLLINIVPRLEQLGLSLDQLRNGYAQKLDQSPSR